MHLVAVVSPHVHEAIALAAGNDHVGDRDQLVDDRCIERADLHAETTVGEDDGTDRAVRDVHGHGRQRCATRVGDAGGSAERRSEQRQPALVAQHVDVDVDGPERDHRDAGRHEQRRQRSRVGEERRHHQHQATEQRHAMEHRRERAKLEDHAIEDDVERRQERARSEQHDEPRVAGVERRRLPVERQEEEQHPLVEVLQRVGHREEPQLHLRRRMQVRLGLRATRAEETEEEQHEEPRRRRRDRQPARVIEALLRERHDRDAEPERVGGVEPPQLAAVRLHERPQALARGRRVRHRLDDADVLRRAGGHGLSVVRRTHGQKQLT